MMIMVMMMMMMSCLLVVSWWTVGLDSLDLRRLRCWIKVVMTLRMRQHDVDMSLVKVTMETTLLLWLVSH